MALRPNTQKTPSIATVALRPKTQQTPSVATVALRPNTQQTPSIATVALRPKTQQTPSIATVALRPNTQQTPSIATVALRPNTQQTPSIATVALRPKTQQNPRPLGRRWLCDQQPSSPPQLTRCPATKTCRTTGVLAQSCTRRKSARAPTANQPRSSNPTIAAGWRVTLARCRTKQACLSLPVRRASRSARLQTACSSAEGT